MVVKLGRVQIFVYFASVVTNNCMSEEINSPVQRANICYYDLQKHVK